MVRNLCSFVLGALFLVGCIDHERRCTSLQASIEAHEWCLVNRTCLATQEDRYWYIEQKTNWIKYSCAERTFSENQDKEVQTTG